MRDNNEASLIALATQPDLSSTKLRTIGLDGVLSPLTKLLGSLSVEQAGMTRLRASRNGAIHVGAANDSREVLVDALVIYNALLDRPRPGHGSRGAADLAVVG